MNWSCNLSKVSTHQWEQKREKLQVLRESQNLCLDLDGRRREPKEGQVTKSAG